MWGELAFFLVCRLMPRGKWCRDPAFKSTCRHLSNTSLGRGRAVQKGNCPHTPPPLNSSIPKDGKLRVGDLGDDVEGTHQNRTDSSEGLMLKLKLQHFDHLMQRANSLEKTLMLGKTENRKRSG